MIAVISLVVVVMVSLLVVRVATVALTLTGISEDLARFQARSAFTGSGFTTDESERVVGHPVRRRIIMLLMLLGNAGLVSAASTLFLSFTNLDEGEGVTGSVWFRASALAVGLIILWLLAHSQWVDQQLSRIIALLLKRWTDIDTRDYAGLLHLTGDYSVSELNVHPDGWLAGKSLSQLGLSREGVLVLGVEREDGGYLGAPRGEAELHPGDTVLLYGRQKVLASIDARRAGPEGNREHVESVSEQAEVERSEREEDEADSKESKQESGGDSE